MIYGHENQYSSIINKIQTIPITTLEEVYDLITEQPWDKGLAISVCPYSMKTPVIYTVRSRG